MADAPRRVILESPFAGDVEANLTYARACVRDSLMRGEAPIASHLLYTQPGILNDADPAERAQGIEAGLAWGVWAELTVIYIDRGISSGVLKGLRRAVLEGRPFEVRSLTNNAAAVALAQQEFDAIVGTLPHCKIRAALGLDDAEKLDATGK